MKKSLSFAVAALYLLSATGCATLFGKNDDVITIHSNTPDAKILVNGNEIGTGTATYTLVRPQTAIITAHKKGCDDRSVPTTQAFNDTAVINTICILCWGIDAITGKIHLTQPTDYTVTPDCSK